ncbi:DUF2288 family protein [Bacteriovoracaceae bacterium]|nr:DUF2288 family protein [Bacteriovoracaceae bacterium]
MTRDLYNQIKNNLLLKSWFELEDENLNTNFFLVTNKLHIVDAAYRIQLNDDERILQWMNTGEISKLQREKIKLFNSVPEKEFYYYRVDDYNLLQEKSENPKEKFLIKP